jgi:quercetin dioxygenase-like cupin family protein
MDLIARTLPISTRPFARRAETAPVEVAVIEGRRLPAPMQIASLLVGREANLMWESVAHGTKVPPHRHGDHESIIYLVSGRQRLWVGGAEYEAGPGDAWLHERGVEHSSEALEDCVQIEFKTPATRTW